jgi:hypothetical protein
LRSGVSLVLALPDVQYYPKLHHHFPIRYYSAVAGVAGVGDAAVVVGVDAGAVDGSGAFSAICCDVRPSQVVVVPSVPGRERSFPIRHHLPSLRCYFEGLWTPIRSDPRDRRHHHHHHHHHRTFAPRSPHYAHQSPRYLDGDSIQNPVLLIYGRGYETICSPSSPKPSSSSSIVSIVITGGGGARGGGGGGGGGGAECAGTAVGVSFCLPFLLAFLGILPHTDYADARLVFSDALHTRGGQK